MKVQIFTGIHVTVHIFAADAHVGGNLSVLPFITLLMKIIFRLPSGRIKVCD